MNQIYQYYIHLTTKRERRYDTPTLKTKFYNSRSYKGYSINSVKSFSDTR